VYINDVTVQGMWKTCKIIWFPSLVRWERGEYMSVLPKALFKNARAPGASGDGHK